MAKLRLLCLQDGVSLLLCKLNATALRRQKVEFWKRCDCFFVVFITHKEISPFPSPIPFPSPPPPFLFFFGCLPFFPFFFILCSTFSKLFLAYNWTEERLLHSNYTYNFPLFVSTVDWEILFHLLYSETCHQPQRLRGDFWLAKDVFRALKPLRFFYTLGALHSVHFYNLHLDTIYARRFLSFLNESQHRNMGSNPDLEPLRETFFNVQVMISVTLSFKVQVD